MMRGSDKMDILRRELRQCVVRQGRWIASLQRGDLAKIQEWADDTRCSLDLFQQLFCGITIESIEGKRRAELFTLFALIKSQEKELQKLSAARAQNIVAEISRLRRGKAVLQGYAVHHQTNAIKFLSSRG